MRAPPAAVWRVAPDQRWQALGASLAALATAAVGFWLAQLLWFQRAGSLLEGLDHEVLVAMFALVICGTCAVFAFWGWRSGEQAAGRLLWTGYQWRFQSDNAPEAGADEVLIDLMLDLGGWMLIRLRPAGSRRHPWRGARWLSIRGPVDQQRGEATQWVAFRAAVYFCASRDHGAPAPQPFPLNDRRGF